MDLKEVIKRIDALDEEILKLLNRRAQVVLEVGELKTKTNASPYVPQREREIMERLVGINKGPSSMIR